MWIGPSAASASDGGDLGGRRGAQGVRRDADRADARHLGAAIVEEAGEAVEIGDEAALLGLGRRAAEGRMGVEDRKQRQADPRRLRRGDDAGGHFGRRGVGRAVGRVMQIVELADRGEACLQHLDIELGGDRLDVVGRHGEREAVHRLAPGPEGVGLLAAALGEPGHAALEGVRVQVAERRDEDRAALVAGPRRDAGLDRGDRRAVERSAARRPASPPASAPRLRG